MDSAADDAEPSDSIRERVSTDSRLFWFALDADRRFVTVVFLIGLFLPS